VPEGDTIFRAARTLNLALAGRTVAVFETVLPALQRVHDDHPIVGRTVVGVRAVGKHLLMEFSDDLVLRTHMLMSGSWHVYRPGERWRRRRSAMRVVVGNDDYVAVAFEVPVAEFLNARDLQRHTQIQGLGPDLLADDFDQGEAARRLRALPRVAVADALLDQRVVAGIGNVFKSEVLFVCGIDPFRLLAEVSDDECARLLQKARDLLRSNVIDPARATAPSSGGYRNTTRRLDPGARLWVYGRSGKPCRHCGTPIDFRRQGNDARATYWCPGCQR